ncbi:flippase-like domain-containing protein [Rickettsiales bacterium]|nr:flippase-like domain-containing protein [Rickettsiales bacterium]
MVLKKNHIIFSAKLIVIACAFYIIYKNADLDRISQYLKNIDSLSLIFAFISLLTAQLVSSYRTRFYFASKGLYFNHKFSIGFYFTGMLLNNVLPGGIGGDGYKIYLVKKIANFPKLTAFRLILSDRASGLLFLIFFAIAIFPFSSSYSFINYAPILMAICLIILFSGYFISTKILLKESYQTALKAAPYSFIIQLLNIICVVFILYGLEASLYADYIILFMISSIFAIIPISIGGVGLRELTFLYGADFLGLDPELGVTIAMLFFIITLICSLNGFLFWHKLEKIYGEK